MLELSPRQKEMFGKDAVHQIYPEYYTGLSREDVLSLGGSGSANFPE